MNARGIIDPMTAGFLLLATLGVILTAIIAAQPDPVNIYRNPNVLEIPASIPAK